MEKCFRYTLTLLIGTVALSQFVQVLMRYVFETPLMGLEEATLIPTLWLYILGSVNASREDTQIRANVLDIFLKTDRARAILKAISDAVSLVVCAWLILWAWGFFTYTLRVGKETPTLYLPTYLYETALFLGLVMMAAFTLWHLLRNLAFLTGLRPSPGHLTGPEGAETAEIKEFQILADTREEKRHD